MILLNNKKGNTLLIVIVAIFVLLSIGLYLNKFVLNQIKISNDTTKMKISNYAAESGLEKALYLIRQDGISINEIIRRTSYNSGNLTNGSSYKIVSDSSYSPNIQIPTIQKNTTYSLDITNFLRSIRSFKVSWTSSSNEILNISITRYRNNIIEGYNFNKSYNHYLDSPVIANINIRPRNGRVYKFELSPRLYDVNNVVITFYSGKDATGNIVNTVSGQNQRIKSIGNIGNNNKSVISDFLINSQY